MILKRGSRGDKVRLLQEGLDALGFDPGPIDGIFERKTEDALEEFQITEGLLCDGVLDDTDIIEWNSAMEDRGFEHLMFPVPVQADKVENIGSRLSWVKVEGDKWNNIGFPKFFLRSDTATHYEAFRTEVLGHGGLVVSAGGKRELSSGANPSRSKKSMHYTGRAFDLAPYAGMQDPAKDIYLVEPLQEARRFRVWCKVPDHDIPERTLTVCHGRSYHKRQRWTGRAIDISAMALQHGFKPIRARRSFVKGTGSYMGAEWWHFQYEEGLIKGETTFGSDLLRVYSEDKCRAFIYWEEVKNAVFGNNWF